MKGIRRKYPVSELHYRKRCWGKLSIIVSGEIELYNHRLVVPGEMEL